MFVTRLAPNFFYFFGASGFSSVGLKICRKIFCRLPKWQNNVRQVRSIYENLNYLKTKIFDLLFCFYICFVIMETSLRLNQLSITITVQETAVVRDGPLGIKDE